MSLTWQTWILTCVAVATIPLYLRVMYILIKFRSRQIFKTHFYAITINQGFIDLVGFAVYYCCFNLRAVDAFKPMYAATNGTLFVNFSYIQTYFFQYARIAGVVFVSVQRCITVAYSRSTADHYLQKCPSKIFIVVQWILPVLIFGNVMFANVYFDAGLNHVIPADVLLVHYWKSASIPAVSIVICLTCYALILRTLKQNGVRSRREFQLTIQVVGLQIALLATSIHFILQLFFTYNKMTDAVYAMRGYLPMWVGFLTFINPWMMILVNRDVRTLSFGSGSKTGSRRVSEAPTTVTGRSKLRTVNPARAQF